MLLPTKFGVVTTDQLHHQTPPALVSRIAERAVTQGAYLVCCERARLNDFLGAFLALLPGMTFILYDGNRAPSIEALRASPGRVSPLKLRDLDGGEDLSKGDVVILDTNGYLARATESQFAAVYSAARSGKRLFILTPYLARGLTRADVVLARKLTLLKGGVLADNASVVKHALLLPEVYVSLFGPLTWIALAEKKVTWRLVRGIMQPAEAAEYEALEGTRMDQEDHTNMRPFHLVGSKLREVQACIARHEKVLVYAPLQTELSVTVEEEGRYICRRALDNTSWPKPRPGEKWTIILLQPAHPEIVRWIIETMYSAAELCFYTFVWGRQKRLETADQHFWRMWNDYYQRQDAIHSTLRSAQHIPAPTILLPAPPESVESPSLALLPAPPESVESPSLALLPAPPESVESPSLALLPAPPESVESPSLALLPAPPSPTFPPSPTATRLETGPGPEDFTIIDHESLEENPPVVTEEEAMQGVTIEMGNQEAAPPPPVQMYSDVPKDLLVERRYKELARMVIKTRDWWTPNQLELFEEALCRLDPAAPRFEEHIEDVLRKVDRYDIERPSSA